MPTVLPASSVPTNFDFSHFPAAIEAAASGIRRRSASRTPKVCSTAETTLPVGEFSTSTPRAEAAGTSTLSTPTPARPTTDEARSRREERRVDARGAADEKRVGFGERGEELVAPGAREVHDLVPRAAEEVEARRRDLLGDDDAAHAAASPALSSSAARRASSEARSTSPMWPMRNVEAFHFP